MKQRGMLDDDTDVLNHGRLILWRWTEINVLQKLLKK